MMQFQSNLILRALESGREKKLFHFTKIKLCRFFSTSTFFSAQFLLVLIVHYYQTGWGTNVFCCLYMQYCIFLLCVCSVLKKENRKKYVLEKQFLSSTFLVNLQLRKEGREKNLHSPKYFYYIDSESQKCYVISLRQKYICNIYFDDVVHRTSYIGDLQNSPKFFISFTKIKLCRFFSSLKKKFVHNI